MLFGWAHSGEIAPRFIPYPVRRTAPSQTGEPVKPSKKMRPKSRAALIPAVKAVICGAIGASALVYAFTATGPQAGFLPFAMFIYSIPTALAAVWYLLAAFLLARAKVGWRVFGALLDGSASLAISWALV